VVEKGRDGGLRAGLRDGRIVPISNVGNAVRRGLGLYDVVYVRVVEDGKGRGARAELRVRPQVQGAALVLENKTGRILAMAGGFSYPLSQLNRVAQTARQPGSSLKPLVFLAALNRGLQPNTTVLDDYITLPPIGVSPRYAREEHYWTPKNYGGDSRGPMTLRSALENSRNLVTARLLDGGIKKKPEESLKAVCALAKENHIYHDCIPYYPFVLGAQPVRVLDLATFYATIANEGMRPEPHAVEAVERDGNVIYRRPETPPVAIDAADKVAYFQLKSILQGVLSRGTGRRIGYMAPFVAGKTGTSTDWNDAWFVGFSNDVTVAIWVGYDNAGRTRRTLGSGGTGSGTAIPIFEPIMKASWEHVAPQTALAPPTPDTRSKLVVASGRGDDDGDGRRESRRKRWSFTEYLRADKYGRALSPDYSVASRHAERSAEGRRYEEKPKKRAYRHPYDYGWSTWGGGGYGGYGGGGGFGGYGGRYQW
jgi:penicillin-binding protein 1A